jgi:peptide/nickel transport system permease protein
MKRFVFVLRRLLLLGFVLPAVSLLAFTVSRVIPGDPIALLAGPTAKPETREALRKAWGLDQPIPVQYLLYLNRLAHGDLGLSLHTGRSVTTDLIDFFPATIELSTAALLLGLPFAILGGVIAAVKSDSWIDYLIRSIVGIGISVPVFWFGILLILVFSAQLEIFPSVGRLPVQTAIPPRVTGMYTVDAALAGQFETLRDALLHLALPAFALAVTVVAPVARITRTNMLAALRQDYVRTARAKGLPGRLVIYRHALRNALLPIITSIGLVYGLLLAGAVVTESVFSWPGVGFYVTKSILSLDFQPVISFTLVSALIYVIINLIVDSAYVFIDPRVEVH